MKCKNKLIKILIFLILIIPLTTLAYSPYVIPGGETIGIEVNSKGILVVGFYEIDNKYIAKDAGFKLGDTIIKINNKEVESINEMIDTINTHKDNIIDFTILRNNKEEKIKLTIKDDKILKTGIYVKDKINGVGTLSYIDPTTKIFGSLGHEIIENKTAKKFEIKDGKIYEANVSSINKSKIGNAGEKNAIYNKNELFGNIKENDITGIYGIYTDNITKKETIEVGNKSDITIGPAKIRTVIKDNIVEEFDIKIIKINPTSDTKNILFEITDENLLKETGGIIQGMSGSPIIQNNKLIGAVNYVILNSPTKGYGIFITTMLKEGEN